ncbi:MAG: hypothetical protein ACREIA_03955, partial [Opitutaceae bacterium]
MNRASLQSHPPAFRCALALAVVIGVLASAAAIPARAASADQLHAALGAFTGEWEGEVRVHAIDGFLLKTLPAHRAYRWEGDEQIVETGFTDGDAGYASVSRHYIELGRLHATAERKGLPPERYFGEISDGGISWTNSERNSRDYREKITTRGGNRTLEATSFEVVRLKGISGLVRLAFSFKPTASALAADSGSGAANAALTARVAELGRELSAARDAAAASERSLADRARETEDLRDRFEKLQTESDETGRRAGALEEERDNLAATVRELRETAADATADSVAEVQKERDALAGRVESAEQRVLALTAGLAGATEKLEQQAGSSARAASDNDALRAQLEKLQSERDALAGRLDAANRSVEQLSAEHADASEGQAALEKQLADARREAEQLRREAAEAAAEMASAAERVTTSESERAAFARRLAETEEKLAAHEDAESANTALEKRLSDLRARDEQSTRQAGAAEALATKLKDATGQRDRLDAELARAREQIESLQSDLETSRSGAGADAARWKKLQADLAAAVTSRASRESEIASLRTNMQAANNRSSDLAHSLRQAESAAGEARAQLAQLRKENDALADKAGSDSGRLTARIQELETTVESAEKARAAALANADALEQTRSGLQERVASLEKDLAAAAGARETRDTELASLKKTAAAAEARATELAESIARAEEAAAESARRIAQL